MWDLSCALSSVRACTPQLEGHSDRVTALFWSTDGRVCSLSGDTARVWEVSTGQHVQAFDSLTLVSWSNDNTRICGAGTETPWDSDSENGQVIRIDVQEVSSGHRIQSLTLHLGSYPVDCCVSWSSDNNKICVGAGKIIRVWEVSSGRRIQTFRENWSVTSTSWSSDGSRICSGDELDNKVRIWDVESGECIQTLEGQGLSHVTSVSWSSDGSKICGGDDSTVLVWEVKSGRCIRAHESPPWHDKMTLSWSPDCKMIRGWSRRGTVQWEVESGRRHIRANPCEELSICPTNPRLAVVVDHNIVHCLRLLGGSLFLRWTR